MKVKPKSGMIVRRPEPPHAALPAGGAKVPESSYWMRRLRDGDIEKIGDKPARKRFVPARDTDK